MSGRCIWGEGLARMPSMMPIWSLAIWRFHASICLVHFLVMFTVEAIYAAFSCLQCWLVICFTSMVLEIHFIVSILLAVHAPLITAMLRVHSSIVAINACHFFCVFFSHSLAEIFSISALISCWMFTSSASPLLNSTHLLAHWWVVQICRLQIHYACHLALTYTSCCIYIYSFLPTLYAYDRSHWTMKRHVLLFRWHRSFSSCHWCLRRLFSIHAGKNYVISLYCSFQRCMMVLCVLWPFFYDICQVMPFCTTTVVVLALFNSSKCIALWVSTRVRSDRTSKSNHILKESDEKHGVWNALKEKTLRSHSQQCML